MSVDDFDKSFSALISKLGHPVEEIRLRALESLQAKLNLKLIADVDILQYKYLYIKLLEWFNFPSPPKRDVVLQILLQLSKNESAAYHLHSIGAVNFFNSLRIDLTPELERCVDEILENIVSQHFTTSPVSNLSRSESTSCQLVKSNTQSELGNSTLFQLPLLNLTQPYQPEYSVYRPDASQSAMQTLSNRSGGTRGILKLTGQSMSNLFTTYDDALQGSSCQFLTVFPLIHLTPSDRTVLANIENALLSRDDPSAVISHCHFLSNVVLNDFPAELFLQRSFILKRLLALLNENNDELITASLTCLKDYASHLQRRIKILRDPACFCPNLRSSTEGIKEQVQDDFDNTMASARSVSSINSATSNGYRHPSQWSLKQDESPPVDQPSSLDILDFCYSTLLGTFDLLRRLTIKDCLHTCLQLNNPICQIIDLFVKHNYGMMNFEFYSVLFYRLHSLIKQQLTIGYTFHSRTIYIHALHVFSTLLHTIEWSEEVVQQLPQEFYELIYYILMDECFHFSYPHIRDRILPIAEKFDRDNYQVYVKSNDVCQSFAAACQILTADEEKSQQWISCVKHAEESLLGLPYHLNFQVIKRFVNICSKISSSHSPCDLAEKNSSIDVLVKFLTHEQAEIRSAVYCSIAMLVASRLSVEETVKSSNKPRKNTHLAAKHDETQFVCNIRVLTELATHGMNDLATKVADHSRLVLLHLLQSKLLVSDEYWRQLMTIIAVLLPQLQCYGNKIDPLGQCILSLTGETEREKDSLFTLNQRFQASLRFLFSKDKDVRKSGYRQCVGYLLSNTRLRLDDFYQFYPADKLFDLFIGAIPTTTAEILGRESVNIESFLRVYTIFTDRTKIDANVRKSALEQMSTMLQDPSLHASFLNHGGLERLLEELRLNVKRDDLVCSTDYHSTIPSCVKIIRLLIQNNRNLQKKFSLDNDLLKLFFKTTVCCHGDLEIVSNLSHTLILLLFDRTLHLSTLADQEFQQQTFSVDFLLAKHFQFPIRVPVHSSTSPITTALNRPDPLRETIVQQKFRLVWNTLWHGNVEQLDQDMDMTSFTNDQQVDFQSTMVLTENDRKCFSLTYTRRTIRLQLNLLNESSNHESMMETLIALRCLLLLVTHDNVHLIDFNQFGSILDKYFQVVPSSCQDEKLLQSIFELLEQISYGFHLSIQPTDQEFFSWFKHILLNPFISLLASNKDFGEMRQTKRDLLKKLFRFLTSFYSHSIVSSEYFTEKLFSNILNYIQQSKSHTFSKLTLITGAMDVLQQITSKTQWFVIFDNVYLQQMADLLIAVIETFHDGRKEASSSFMAHALIRASSQTLLNTLLALKSSLSTTNRRQEMSVFQEWLETSRVSFDWLRNLWFYIDIEIRIISYALTAVFATESCGRDLLFISPHRLDEGHLFTILLDEDECSAVKEQVCNVLINLTYALIDNEAKLATGNSLVALPDLTSALNDCDFMQRMGSSIFSNLYPFVALDLDALRVNQTTASPVSPLFVGNLCAFLFNLRMLGIHQETVGLVKLLLSFLDVRPLESKMNSNVTPNEYHRFLDQMFYMYTKIAQYLRLIFESTSEILSESVTNDHLVQLVALLSYFPDNQGEQSENFWQSKIHLAHFLTNILLQQSSSLHEIINQTIVQHAAALFNILSLPLSKMINGSISAAISIILQLLSLSIAQCTLDQAKEIWKDFFDQSAEGHGTKIFDQLLIVYENRLNTESNDTLKLTVSNMIKSLLNISSTAKEEAVKKGLIESQIDHLKRVQTKLTLFSLQSDRCVSKDEILIDECVQVLSVLNNLAYDCVDVKDILSSSGLVPFLHQLWCWAIVDVQLLNVILLLLTTLTAKHRKGCVSVCSTVLPSANAFVVQTPDQQRPLSNLLSYVLRLISKASLASAMATNNPASSKHQTIEMAFDIVQNCSLEIEGRSLVYKSTFYQICLEHFERVSRDVHRYDRRFLDVLVNISFFVDGQTSLLKNAELFPVLVRLAHSSPSTVLQRQSLLILRNLAFSSTHKARIVAEAKYIPAIMSHVVSRTSDTAYIGLTALWALIVDAQKGKVAVRSSNVLPALFDVKTQQRNKENLPCYHAVSNVIQMLTED